MITTVPGLQATAVEVERLTTVRVNGAVLSTGVASVGEPVMDMVKVPAGVVLLVEITSEDMKVGEPLEGVNVHVAPVGSPLQERVTV